jgi:hypothetical protein
MGLEQTVTFRDGSVPRWTEVSDLLERREFPVQVRMIDGELALPGGTVLDSWREFRVSTPPGMITLKRQDHRIIFVAWANADAALRQAWNALTWAFAELGDGRITAPDGPCDRKAFYRSADLPALIKRAG